MIDKQLLNLIKYWLKTILFCKQSSYAWLCWREECLLVVEVIFDNMQISKSNIAFLQLHFHPFDLLTFLLLLTMMMMMLLTTDWLDRSFVNVRTELGLLGFCPSFRVVHLLIPQDKRVMMRVARWLYKEEHIQVHLDRYSILLRDCQRSKQVLKTKLNTDSTMNPRELERDSTWWKINK